MSQLFVCARGHRWQADDPTGTAAATQVDGCPHCGLPAVTEGTELLDSGATVAPDKGQALSAEPTQHATSADLDAPHVNKPDYIWPTQDIAGDSPPPARAPSRTEEIGTQWDSAMSGIPAAKGLPTQEFGTQADTASRLEMRTEGGTVDWNADSRARPRSQDTTDLAPTPTSAAPDSNATVARGDSEVGFTVDQSAVATMGNVAGYELLKELGRGAMGVVYKARQVALNRMVALKMVLAGQHASPRILARFQIEAEAVASLHHPNIVQIYEIGEANGCPFFSLEFVDGGTLSDRVATQRMPARDAAWVVQQLGRAMDSAHRRGVLHRDLKPDNVLLTRGTAAANGSPAPVTECVPKITDFGLAKRLESDSSQTHAGTIMGTPSYMAPEQAEGRIDEVGPLADIYALGAILYDLLTGRPPFQGSTVLETLDQVKKLEPTPPRRFSSKVPIDLDTICLKCLEKDPAKRYPSAGDLSDDLGRFLNGEPIQARPTPLWERAVKWCRRRPGAASVVGASSFLAVGLVAFAVWFTQHEHARAEEEGRLRQGEAEQRKIAEAKTIAEAKQRKIAEQKTKDEAEQRKIAENKTKIAEQKTKDEAEQRRIAEQKTRDEEKQRKIAEQKTKDEAEQRKLAETNFQAAEAAVDVLLTRIGQQRLEGEPRMEQLRRELLEEALRFYDRFLTQKGDRPELQWETGKANKKVGDIRRLQGDDKKAEEAYRTSLKLFDALIQTLQDRDRSAGSVLSPAKVQRDQAAAWNSLGQLLADQARQQEADDAYGHSAQLLEQLVATAALPEYRQELAILCYNRGLASQRAGKNDVAEELLQKARDLQQVLVEQLSGPNPALAGTVNPRLIRQELARSLVSLGQFYQERNNPDKGVEYVKQSLPIYKELTTGTERRNPNLRQEAAFAHRRLGLLLRNRDRKQAENELRVAIQESEALTTDFPSVPDFRQDTAASINDLADSLLDQGKTAEAEREFKRSLDLRDKLVIDFPNKPDYQRDLANTLNDYGLMLQTTRRLPDSLREYNRAVEVMEKLAKQFASVPDYRQKLAQFRINKATVLQLTNKPAEAAKLFREAQAQADLLVKLKGNQPSEIFEGARALFLLATWLQASPPPRPQALKEQLQQAEEFHRKARAQLRTLAESYPDQPDYREYLVDCLNNLGDLLRATDRAEQALALWKEGDREATRLVEKYRDKPTYRQKQARLLHNMGVVLSLQKQLAEAESAHRKALALREKLVHDNEKEPAYAQELASSHAELAIVFARRNQLEESAASYRTAIDLLHKFGEKFPDHTEFWLDEMEHQTNLIMVLGVLGQEKEARERGQRIDELKAKLAKAAVKP